MAGLMTLDEAAEQLRLTPNAIRRRIKRGDLQAVKLGSAHSSPVRIAETELERYLRAGRTGER